MLAFAFRASPRGGFVMTSSSLFWSRHTCAREDAQGALPEDVPTSRCSSCSEGVSDTLNDECHSGPRKADGGEQEDARKHPASPQRSRCTACTSVPGPSAQVRLALPWCRRELCLRSARGHNHRRQKPHDGEKSVTAKASGGPPEDSGLAGGLVPDRGTDRQRERTQDRSVVVAGKTGGGLTQRVTR